MRAKNPAIIAKGVRLIIANCLPSRSPEKKKIFKFYFEILWVDFGCQNNCVFEHNNKVEIKILL